MNYIANHPWIRTAPSHPTNEIIQELNSLLQ